ncbi:hypothetical protein K458DRAFT_86614 [Lentithecium fluviatile CBS 122367]|uniref:Uncharacterized protein n=1 Tax=Lentithecium fluviatile CBS 122367 TaxID=1168545 RepID=A0A6G1ITC7_9PLEO|nr:hypothetical protein K458DRAFT_86614 [Lentithecium fluviatile CBS 122367]
MSRCAVTCRSLPRHLTCTRGEPHGSPTANCLSMSKRAAAAERRTFNRLDTTLSITSEVVSNAVTITTIQTRHRTLRHLQNSSRSSPVQQQMPVLERQATTHAYQHFPHLRIQPSLLTGPESQSPLSNQLVTTVSSTASTSPLPSKSVSANTMHAHVLAIFTTLALLPQASYAVPLNSLHPLASRGVA